MLRLRPYKMSDARRIVTWIADHDAFSAWCADKLDWPLTEASLEKCHAEFAERDDSWLMTALDETGVPVGFLMMTKGGLRRQFPSPGADHRGPGPQGTGAGHRFPGAGALLCPGHFGDEAGDAAGI